MQIWEIIALCILLGLMCWGYFVLPFSDDLAIRMCVRILYVLPPLAMIVHCIAAWKKRPIVASIAIAANVLVLFFLWRVAIR